MKQIQAFFKKTVTLIEQYPLPLHRYVLLFAAILSIRLCLEFFANQRLFRLDDVIHIGLWFVFIVEAFMLQLHLFSKVRTEQIIKLVVCCFSIALTAPLIDLLVSQGKFSKMNYLSVNSVSDIGWSYLTIGGASLSRGATIGIRIEIVLLVIASFNYVYLKTKSVLRSLIGTISIYTVLFLSGAIPFFIGLINSAFNLQYGPGDQSSVNLLFLLDILLFLVLAYRSGQKLLSLKFSFLRVFRMTGLIALLLFGAWMARRDYPSNWKPDPTTIYQFPLLAIIILLLFVAESHGRRGINEQGNRFYTKNGLLLLLICTSAIISFHTCFAVLIAWALLFFLYEKPLNFIRVPILSQLLQACQSCAFLFIGFMSFRAPMIGIGTNVLFLTLIGSFSIYLGHFYFKRYIRINYTSNSL